MYYVEMNSYIEIEDCGARKETEHRRGANTTTLFDLRRADFKITCTLDTYNVLVFNFCF